MRLLAAMVVMALCVDTGQALGSDHPGHDNADVGLAKTASSASVSGVISVQKGRKITTDGPKSYKDVVVYLEAVKKAGKETDKEADKDTPKEKSATGKKAKKAKIDQKGLVFVPHVLAIQVGTTVDFHNSDTVNHNVFCMDKCCGENMDLGQWGRDATRSYTFNIPGAATLLCKLHPEMAAYVVVLETPYFTTIEIDGKTRTGSYRLTNVPPGRYTLKTWHKKLMTDPVEVVVKADGQLKTNLELKRKPRRRRRR